MFICVVWTFRALVVRCEATLYTENAPTNSFAFLSSAPYMYTTRNKKRTNQCKQNKNQCKQNRHRGKKSSYTSGAFIDAGTIAAPHLPALYGFAETQCTGIMPIRQQGGRLLIEGKGKRSKPNRRAERSASQKCPFHRRPQSIGSTEEEDVRESEVSPLRRAPLPKGRPRGAKLAPG